VRHVVVFEAPHDHHDGVGFPNVRQKGVAQALSARRAAHQAGDVDEAHRRVDELVGPADVREHFDPRIGDRNLADVGLDRGERVVGGERLRRARQRVEDRRLAHVGQADDPA